MFLGVIKNVNSNTYLGNGNFGEQYNVASGERYFNQSCYNKASSDDKFNNDINVYDDIILSNINDSKQSGKYELNLRAVCNNNE